MNDTKTMNIEQRKEGEVAVVSLDGRLDGFTAPDLEQAVRAAVERGDTRVLLECGLMSYISSAGLRALLVGARQCQQNGGKLAIAALQPACHSVMEASGFLTVIDCHDSSEAALAALAGASP